MLILRHLRQVVTLQGGPAPRRGRDMDEIGLVADGAIVIRGDHVAWVGPDRSLPSDFAGCGARTLDGAGRDLVALPGFVDGHTHPIFARTRVSEYELRSRGKSYEEIAEAGGGIRSSVRGVRDASLEDLVSFAERHLPRFLEHGTTTIEGKSGYGLSVEDELKSLKALARAGERSPLDIVPTFLGAHDVPDEFRARRADYVDLVIREMIPRVRGEGLAQFCDVFCDTGYFSPDEARRILEAARKAGLGLRVHAEQLSRTGAAALAAELGARSADHLEWISEDDIAHLRDAGTVATLVPGAAFNLGTARRPPARGLIDGGVPVALATDFNPGSCFSPNMQLVLSMACSQLKMTPAEAVTAATLNGAFGLGLHDRMGSIEAGKQADIAVMAVSDYREIPYYFGVNHCAVTLKKGRVVHNRLEAW